MRHKMSERHTPEETMDQLDTVATVVERDGE